MNIQPGGTISRRPLPRQECRQWLGKMRVTIQIFAYVLALAAILNGHIWLRQQTTTTERRIRQVQREISSLRRQLENPEIRYAQLSSWSHIRERIAHFNLKLHPAEPGQVRPIAFLTPAQAARTPLAPLRQTASAVPAVPVQTRRIRKR